MCAGPITDAALINGGGAAADTRAVGGGGAPALTRAVDVDQQEPLQS